MDDESMVGSKHWFIDEINGTGGASKVTADVPGARIRTLFTGT